MLTDEECDEFRRLPVSFNDMVRVAYGNGSTSKGAAIYKAGKQKGIESMSFRVPKLEKDYKIEKSNYEISILRGDL